MGNTMLPAATTRSPRQSLSWWSFKSAEGIYLVALLAVLATYSVFAHAGIFSSEDDVTPESVRRFMATLPRIRAVAATLPNPAANQEPAAPDNNVDSNKSLPQDLSKFHPFSDYIDALEKVLGRARLDSEAAKDSWPSINVWASVGNRIAAAIMVIQRDNQTETLKSRQSELSLKAKQMVLSEREKNELGAIRQLLSSMPKWKADTSDVNVVQADFLEIQRGLAGSAH
jgi:hypothetical protein